MKRPDLLRVLKDVREVILQSLECHHPGECESDPECLDVDDCLFHGLLQPIDAALSKVGKR